MSSSRSEWFLQFFGVLLTLATVLGSAIYFVMDDRFGRRIEVLEQDNAQLRLENQEFSRRISEISQQNVVLQDQIYQLSVQTSAARSVRVVGDACGRQGHVLNLCAERSEAVGTYRFALLRVDMSSGAPRSFMTIQHGDAATRIVDAFSGERPIIDEAGRRVSVLSVSADPPRARLDTSSLQ